MSEVVDLDLDLFFKWYFSSTHIISRENFFRGSGEFKIDWLRDLEKSKSPKETLPQLFHTDVDITPCLDSLMTKRMGLFEQDPIHLTAACLMLLTGYITGSHWDSANRPFYYSSLASLAVVAKDLDISIQSDIIAGLQQVICSDNWPDRVPELDEVVLAALEIQIVLARIRRAETYLTQVRNIDCDKKRVPHPRLLARHYNLQPNESKLWARVLTDVLVPMAGGEVRRLLQQML